ncbi:50S ribosomal protein L11 methyltransferase [Desulfurivibrio sp. D14AmB]|uniref:50S ribosomal protein L11 methyltransferase n=1 Tax=Desulfurivibrio sp. D14AmB TaxID=3374370 RepID=UPI00376ED5B7
MANQQTRNWLQLSIRCPAAMADHVAALLASFNPQGTEQGYSGFDESPEWETVSLYLEDTPATKEQLAEIETALETLRRLNPTGPTWEITRQLIADCDWNATWKKQFTPLPVVPGLVIKPSWEDYLPQPGEKVIEMDPGMAFGTGHHASTRLALELLAELCRGKLPPASVLDYGCGTGILAMAAALWGCPRVLALDNDPEAVAVAGQNILVNQLAAMIKTGLPEELPPKEQFAVVMANITTDVLLRLATTLAAATRPGGYLILAGILAGEQEQAIHRCFRELGLELAAHPRQEEWAACRFKKPA